MGVLEGDLNVLLAKVHLRGESGGGLPLARGAGSSLLQHLVDLLEGKTLGLGHEEVGEEEGDAAERTPQEEDVGAQACGVGTVGHKVGSNDTDDAVPEPCFLLLDAAFLECWRTGLTVGRGRKTDTAGTDGEREDLANDDPGSGTPGGSENGNVQADEGDHGTGGVGVGWVVDSVLASSGTNCTNDELHDDHTSGTEDENRTTSNLLNHDERGRSREHVDEGGDETDEEGVLN